MREKVYPLLQKTINFLLFAALVFNALNATANMAAPSQGGTLTGEPNGLEKIFIRHEQLTIDFRPMGEIQSKKTVNVEAVYQIENIEAAKKLKLVFVLGSSQIEGFNFYLDDQRIPSRVGNSGDLPLSWKSPLSTPWHGDNKLALYPNQYSQQTAVIELVIPNGRHTLKAEYKSTPATYNGYAPRQLFQFAYIFAPARDWAGFGGLDLTIQIPDGWELVSEPKLEQTGTLIQKHYDQIPADSLGFTFGKPLPPGYYQLDTALFWLAVLSVFIPPGLIVWLFIRQNRFKIINPVLGFLLGLGWAALVGVAGLAAAFGADYIYPTITYGYGGFFSVVFIAMLCFAVFIGAGLSWLIGALIVNKRKQV